MHKKKEARGKKTVRDFLSASASYPDVRAEDMRFLESQLLETMRNEGFSDEQIYEMPFERFIKSWGDAFLLNVENDLAHVTSKPLLKGLLKELGKTKKS